MQDNVTRCLGLVTQYSPLSVAAGALVVADDCVIRRENIIENRRGYALYGSVLDNPLSLLSYRGRIIANLANNTVVYDNGAGVFAPYSGSYTAPTGHRMRGVENNQNLYVTTSKGVKVFGDITGTSGRLAGVPRSLDPSYSLNAAASGFMLPDSQCAYRTVIVRTDQNGNTIIGYPSTRLVAYNTAITSKNIDLVQYLPAEVTTTDIIQFYRTEQFLTVTEDLSGDEMGLVYQVSPTPTDIANGYITFTDSIVDALRGATLYTSPSQEGIAQANERPPLAKDLALYKSSFLFFANTSTKQRLNITLVGTASLTGKTVTIGGVTYKFGASEIISGGGAPQAKVGATGVAAVDIDDTARSLVRVINRYAGNTSVYAYYLSGPDDLPGQIMLEERGVGAAAFTAQASDNAISAMFFPAPPVGPATDPKSTSSNSVQKNALYYAKDGQPEAVPLLNYLPVGPANKEILRTVTLRDSLIIIKEEGVYRLTGETPQSFNITPLDLTVYCRGKDSVVVLANQVYMLSNQGIVSITDTGVQVVSREVSPNITPLLSLPSTDLLASACGYESETAYLISVPSTSLDTAASQTYVYNVATRTWVRWTFGFNAAMVEPMGDKLYFSVADVAKVYRERKTFTSDDYADPDYAVTITAITGSNITFESPSAVPRVGWVVSQSSPNLLITSVIDHGGASYTCETLYPAPASWLLGPGTLYPNITMRVKWDAWSAQQPGFIKHVRQFNILADNIPGNNTASSVVATFSTDLDSVEEEIEISGGSFFWGSSPWGEFPWGGVGDTFIYPTYVPRNKQYGRLYNNGVIHRNALERAAIAGCTYTFDGISERVRK